MKKNNEIRHGRHCIFLMHVHLVFVTKYRREVFSKEILGELRPIFSNVCTSFESELVEFNGEDDHVHLLVNYPSKVAMSKLVNSLKGVSSHLIRKKDYPAFVKNCGVMLYSRLAILRAVAVVPQLLLSASTLSNSKRHTDKKQGRLRRGALDPALKGEVCRARINSRMRLRFSKRLARKSSYYPREFLIGAYFLFEQNESTNAHQEHDILVSEYTESAR